LEDIQAPEWVQDLTIENFLAVYDVVLDIRKELQLTDDPVIEVCPTIIQFRILMPSDGINMRDRYSGLRFKATGLLKKKGIINDFEYLEADHRWENMIRIMPNTDTFQDFADMLDQEYTKRTKDNDDPAQVPAQNMDLLDNILLRFHSVVIQLRKRHDNRNTLDVNDEYDVQDLLNALLRVHFDDIRPESWTPSYAGKSARVDFLLKNENIVIEVKKTRNNLGAKEIGDQLIIDIVRYSKMDECQILICFVYDPENRITNPKELETDLSGDKEGISVKVVVAPKMY